ncbi:phosphoenolpyruvate--protein phosphotransferase [Natronosporangium hydrolyticum]|uniref:Phosphoenolpyruvate-protein phosphotransferase n=1 Tax=Natronosporangium hydrolyticum TaxID=2811111 RepID=A0A895YAF2_9ACTN|nr:phosphoenolpyruvate--protein phosphotransferase [Natronosporangium hydrolyticum]QSB13232.1 phosphoenolpyruvate--protein phosphotransferase [Natronosporangium hydrolyticum]
MAKQLRGIGVSPGAAAGPAYALAPAPQLPSPTGGSDPATELPRANTALAAVAAELTRRAEHTPLADAAEILRAQALMADDPVLRDAVAAAVTAGADAPHAIDSALAEHRRAFLAAGGYLADRVTDLDDLRDRAVAACLDLPMPGIPDPGCPFVLVAADLAPADTAGLDPTQVLAVVTESGGPTSHTAILARSLGLPAVVGCRQVRKVPDGTVLAVDGTTGEVTIAPEPATVAALTKREQARRRRLAATSGPGRTADGQPVGLLANLGQPAELAAAHAAGAEGVGLFRTELLYLDRPTPPSLDEQIAMYTELFTRAGDGRVVVRTLDAGADKPLPFLANDTTGTTEPNPALGVRGYRLRRRGPEVLASQLKAIGVAAQTTGAQVWVMAPMIATPAEAAEFAADCRAHGVTRTGVMIEVPAAALQARAIAAEVDFLSIGTNDLSQYAFAADRECADLADLLDPWQPALLGLIGACTEAGRVAGIPVGVCGEAAADPALAVVLAGLGVNSLSMAPAAIPAVRDSLANHQLADCQRAAEAALAAPDAARARTVARSIARTMEGLRLE